MNTVQNETSGIKETKPAGTGRLRIAGLAALGVAAMFLSACVEHHHHRPHYYSPGYYYSAPPKYHHHHHGGHGHHDGHRRGWR